MMRERRPGRARPDRLGAGGGRSTWLSGPVKAGSRYSVIWGAFT
jgi:hypothetical protein